MRFFVRFVVQPWKVLQKCSHLWLFGVAGKFESLLFKSFHTPECGSDHHTDRFGILQCLGRVAQSGVSQSLSRRGYCEMGIPIVAFHVFLIGEPFLGIKVMAFATDLTRHVGNVESCDSVNGRFAIQTGLKELFVADSASIDNTQTSDDDSFWDSCFWSSGSRWFRNGFSGTEELRVGRNCIGRLGDDSGKRISRRCRRGHHNYQEGRKAEFHGDDNVFGKFYCGYITVVRCSLDRSNAKCVESREQLLVCCCRCRR
jgi:hypothetical protein